MNKLICLIALFAIVNCITTLTVSNSVCKCTQLLNETDCNNLKCYWDGSTCSSYVEDTTTYCSLVRTSLCSQTDGCALISNACISFSGCSVYQYTTYAECQQISDLCTSNGTQCIEINDCVNYSQESSCVRDQNGKYCQWTTTNNKCQIATECTALPTTLNTDTACRSQISTCTMNSLGGCITSGTDCKDQTIEGACVQNLAQTVKCFWNNNQCQDKICSNAPSSNTTNSLCQTFLSTCTVNDTNNGCQTIPTQCSQLNTSGNCIINLAGNTCYFNTNNNKCEDKNCDNAPSSYITDSACRGWINTCTVKSTGIGCADRSSSCSSYTTEIQCVITSSLQSCFWNGSQCVDKTCDNALSTITTYNDCNKYLPTCTIQSDGTGCVSKQSNCTDYSEIQCVAQLDGTLCIFQDNKCIQRICSNALTTLTTNDQCKEFSTTCIINSSQQGCILNQCLSVWSQTLCTYDYNNKQCYYGQQCQLRTCANASSKLTTDDECRQYLSTCTVADNLIGCKIRPDTCDQIKIKEQCVKLSDKTTKCSWNDDDTSNQVCRNLDCTDSPVNQYTNSTCEAFDTTCTVGPNLNTCMVKPNSCDQITQNDQCLLILTNSGNQCSYDSINLVCRNRNCSDASSSIITETDCRQFMSTCTLSSTSQGCQDEPTTCQGYSKQSVCLKIYGSTTLCGWNGCESRTCSNTPTDVTYTHTSCQNYLQTCTVNADQTGCVTLFTQCSDITNQIQCNQTILSNKSTCFYDTTIQTPACRDFQCSDNTSSNMTHSSCQILSKSCTLGQNSIGCVTLFNSCDSITNQTQCEGTYLMDLTSQCSWDNVTDSSNPVCVTRQCKFSQSFATTTDCSTYLPTCTLGNGSCIDKPSQCNGITDEVICNNVYLQNGNQCSFNESITDEALQCEDRVCTDAPTSHQSDEQCKSWLSTCSVRADESGCIVSPTSCPAMTRSQCTKLQDGTLCYWNTNANPQSCRVAQCTDANSTTYTSDTLCQKYMNTCTVAKSGSGCQAMMSSCTTLSQTQCPLVTLSTGGKCSWSGTQCRSRVCSDAPTTYTTETQCRQWLSTCTISQIGTGCSDQATSCSLVETKDQCQTLLLSGISTPCGWNLGCMPRTCSNAPDTYTTDSDCRSYLASCTVQIDKTGCVTRGSTCSDMTVEIQCVQTTDLSTKCSWNSTTSKCQSRSCSNASTTLTTHDQCTSFLETCTIKPSSTGCQTRQNSCAQYTAIGQCVLTFTQTPCQWITQDDTSQCVDIVSNCSSYSLESACTYITTGEYCIWINNACYDRQCSNAPKSYSTHELCQSFSDQCTTNGKGCQEFTQCSNYQYSSSCVTGTDGNCTLVDQCQSITCELAPVTYTTDSSCKTFIPTCTTNGYGCIERKRCQDAYVEEACKTNSSGSLCAWVDSQCYDKSCDTAPISTQSETDCNTYFPTGKCTTKNGGGCIQKGKCSDAQIESACTTQYDGQKCSWQNSTCKLYSCTDLSGYTHKKCNDQQSNCTTDGFNCIAMQTCQNTTNQAACVIGTDGPCIWKNNLCYKFTKCTDLIYTTHTECYSINNECTTNGFNCISINTCENQSKLSCYVGISNGSTTNCIWTPISTSLSASYKCTTFQDCTSAFYLTHSNCYNYSLGLCTSDGVNGCVALDQCTNYTSNISCVIDKNGTVTSTSGLITSTGKCTWSSGQCVSQRCQDLSGTSHTTCNSQLSTCTFNGSKCIVQATCSTFATSLSCQAATGTDGKCQWSNGACSALGCTNYPVTQCSMFSASCIADGSTCVLQTSCEKYTTQAACDYGSPTSTCAWIVSSSSSKAVCKEVTSCSIATSYQKACTSLSDRCYWQTITTSGTSEQVCSTKTCEMQTDGTCTGFYDWAKTTYTVCGYDTTGKCVAQDPTTLNSSQCYSYSLFQYTWSASTSKCQICNAISTNGTDNTSNNTNDTSEGFTITMFSALAIFGIL